MILIIFILLIILDAYVDVLFAENVKDWSKFLENVYKICLFAIPLLYKKQINWHYIILLGLSYWFMHIALFDLSYNLIGGLDLNYVGTTSGIYDDVMSLLSDWQFWVLRGFFAFLSIFVYSKAIKL